MRLSRHAFASLLSITVLGGLVSAPADQAMAGAPRARPLATSTLERTDVGQQIRLTPIHKPTWKPVDPHLFSAEIGTAATGYAEFLETALKILPPPNHLPHPQLGVGPGAPHQPPYNKELRDGVAALRLHQNGPFKAKKEFSNGNGVWLAWMNVPSPGKKGSSPDFTSGPIIPNKLFPIHVTGFSTHDGKLYSTLADLQVPALDTKLDPPFTVDGHSHFPMFIVDNGDFGPAGENRIGGYTWHLKMVDHQGAGWQIETRFVVRG
jgi:hypothetical protein